MSSNDKLRIGVIGLGLRGGLADLVHRHEHAAIVHVCDIDQRKQEEVARRFGDARFSIDAKSLLEDDSLDAVMVLTPDWLHAQHAIAAMQAGHNLFLEKPMAITIADCDRILATAEQTGRKLYVGHNMRHMDWILKIRQVILDGAIGQVQTAWQRHFIAYGGDAYFKDWHAEQRYTTGLLLQKAAHDLDVMHWLCGGYTRRVNAMGRLSVYNRVPARERTDEPWSRRWSNDNWPPLATRNVNPELNVEDLSMLQAELDNGVLLAYQQCHYSPDDLRDYTFIGDAGRVETTRAQGKWVIRLWNRRGDHNPEGDQQFVLEPQAGGHDGADPSMIGEFIAYLRGDAQPRCQPFEARMAVAAGYQATMSLRQGGIPLDIPPIGQASE